MKTKKIIALMLSLAMVLGVVACNNGAEETTTAPVAETTAADSVDETEPEVDESEAEDPVADTSEFVELAIADVADEDDVVMLYGWNEEFPGLVEKYSDIEVELDITESNTYQTKLDQVLASGDNAPDIFVCDADYATKYMNSDNTIAINDLGIAYSELSEMYNYTLQFAADDNAVIKGLAWQACPCGVFYNVNVAEATLGVSEPEDVAPYFATWDAFIETARLVDEASNGEKKIVSGTDDIWRAYLNSRSQGWVVGGEVVIDPVMEDYFELAKILKDEGLTFETSQWGDAWNANMANEAVLSYWGPMWLLNFCFGFGSTNDTAGDWRFVEAPGSFFWGGTWMMASKYCNSKASVAQIMRDVALTDDALIDMAVGGEFVNSVAIMTDIATGAIEGYEGVPYLGGQNPASVLLASAQTIDNSTVGPDDQQINEEFNNVVNSYLNGDIETVADAEATFIANVEELGIV